MSISASVEVYATRDSMVGVVRWLGVNTSYNTIKNWAKQNVKLRGDELWLDTGDGWRVVSVGCYVVLVGSCFDVFTADELEELYIRVDESREAK